VASLASPECHEIQLTLAQPDNPAFEVALYLMSGCSVHKWPARLIQGFLTRCAKAAAGVYTLMKIFFRQSGHSSSQQNASAAMEYSSDAFAGFKPRDMKRA
jgi:hypothetical protein